MKQKTLSGILGLVFVVMAIGGFMYYRASTSVPARYHRFCVEQSVEVLGTDNVDAFCDCVAPKVLSQFSEKQVLRFIDAERVVKKEGISAMPSLDDIGKMYEVSSAAGATCSGAPPVADAAPSPAPEREPVPEAQVPPGDSLRDVLLSVLRDLQMAQEVYYATPDNNNTYASEASSIPDFTPSYGVSITIVTATQTGWAAFATHQDLSADKRCAVFVGKVDDPPAPATVERTIACN